MNIPELETAKRIFICSGLSSTSSYVARKLGIRKYSNIDSTNIYSIYGVNPSETFIVFYYHPTFFPFVDDVKDYALENNIPCIILTEKSPELSQEAPDV